MGRVREQPAKPEQVAAVWRKAVESASDARLTGMSVDGALRSAYDAGHMAALALLAAHGLRPAGGQGHHEAAFAAAAALGYAGLENLVSDSAHIRSLRAGSMYDPTLAGADDLDAAISWMKQILPSIHSALRMADPALFQLLVKPRE